MILTGPAIKEAVARGDITIDPFKPELCGPNSYDFHLGDMLLVYEPRNLDLASTDPEARIYLDPHRENPTREIKIPAEGLVLEPSRLYLGCTVERIGSRCYVPQMVARSSIGRLGMFLFLNSGLGDVGFVGRWTMEIIVVHPLRVRAGDRIGQMVFSEVTGEIQLYRGRYDKPDGVQASRAHIKLPNVDGGSR